MNLRGWVYFLLFFQFAFLHLQVHVQRTHNKYLNQGRKTDMTPEKALKVADADFVFEVKPQKNETPREIEHSDERRVEIASARAGAAIQVSSSEQQSPQQQLEQQLYHNPQEIFRASLKRAVNGPILSEPGGFHKNVYNQIGSYA